MDAPPLSGAVQLTEAVVDEAVATAATALGLPGTLVVNVLDGVDAGLTPLALVAVTVNV